MTTGTRVLLVGDRTDLLAQVRLNVESRPGLVVVGEAGSCCEALAIAAAEKPDLILVDGGSDCMTTLDRVGDLSSAARHLLVISDHVHRQKLVETIVSLLEPEQQKIASLTKPEMDVIWLVAKGLKDGEIAGRLRIRKATVSRHLDSIFLKLGLSDRLDLLIYSLLKGLASLCFALLFLDDEIYSFLDSGVFSFM